MARSRLSGQVAPRAAQSSTRFGARLSVRGFQLRLREQLRSNGCRLTGIGYCLSMSSDEVRRRVVAVTGASGGVGRAVVQEFAKRGDSIALLSRGEVGLVSRGR